MPDDIIKAEDEAAVEGSPAPPHPRPESAAFSRAPAGGSPCERKSDHIDALVDRSIKRGPRTPYYDKCPHCDQAWHGLRIGLCKGSWRHG